MKTGIRILLAAGVLSLLPLAAHACPGEGGPGRGGKGGPMHEGGAMRHGSGHMGPQGQGMHSAVAHEHFLRGLDLSDAQRDKIFALRHAQEPALREKGKAVANAHEEFHRVKSADNYDAAKAKAAAEVHAKAMSEMMLLKSQLHAQVRAVLTPEQKKRLDERESAKLGHMGHGGQAGQGMGRPMAPRG